MNKMDSKQGSGFRVQGSGFSGRQNSSINIHPSSFIPHLSSLILHPMQKPGKKLPGPRRGVLLLLVLALLTLFALVAVAFVLISSQSQRSSKNMQRVDQTLEDPQKLLNEAMMQVARGPSNPVSVMGPHSLLEDMYGNTSVYARITSATPIIKSAPAATDGQLIEITYDLASPNAFSPTGTPPWVSPAINSQYRFLGCVVTILDSSIMGESTRIVGMNPTSGSLQLLATGRVSASKINAYINVALSQYPRIIINSTPFSGTGFGFNPATGKLDAWDPTGPDPSVSPGLEWNYALLPNPSSTAFKPNLTINYTDPAGPGGAN
jgi:hypothetical protein